MELAADFLDDPVPTTSPTKASFELSAFNSVNFSINQLLFIFGLYHDLLPIIELYNPEKRCK